MKNKKLIPIIAIVLVICVVAVVLLIDVFKIRYMTPPTINGVDLSEFTIVYDEDGLDYNKRAAEYIQKTAHSRYGVELPIVDDSAEKAANEIVVGETSRAISSALDAQTKGLEFSILASEGSIALEGDLFIVAAAAYFFMENYALTDAQVSTVPETVTVHEPIIKEAKNYIMLIGDGMGLYQTKMFEYMENTYDYSDGEDIFYGYMLPYSGFSRTDSLKGTTDSAAGGTALACGYKTFNGYIGVDKFSSPVKSLTELANERGMSTAVMSTDVPTGATPSTFLAHVRNRNDTSALSAAIAETQKKYGTLTESDFDTYDMQLIDNKIDYILGKVSANSKGFFLMYEEAYIDKHSYDHEMEKTFGALVRFNQAIARFMEFAFYNPETLILITADHETGDLKPNANGNLSFNKVSHTSADVPIFAYGYGAEIFNGVNIENIQIAHTIASFMGNDSFGDQSEYQSLTKK